MLLAVPAPAIQVPTRITFAGVAIDVDIGARALCQSRSVQVSRRREATRVRSDSGLLSTFNVCPYASAFLSTWSAMQARATALQLVREQTHVVSHDFLQNAPESLATA